MANPTTYWRKECTLTDGKIISYLEAGPQDGTLFIWLHGWPAIGEAWRQQIITFAGLGFRVVAPDMPGYGQSYKSKSRTDFSLENINASLLDFLGKLGSPRAIWAGHDWGAGVLWSLVSHHPETCIGVIAMCVPYRTTELGLAGLVPHINRDMYPESEFPHGQWDYWHFYLREETFEKSVQSFQSDLPNFFKSVWSRGQPNHLKTPSFTASITRNNGWFGGAAEPPEISPEHTLLDQHLHDKLVEAFGKGGFWAPTAYYVNVEENVKYQEDVADSGLIKVPTLFLEAKWDYICDTAVSTLGEPMRKACHNLTEISIDAGHWLPYEAPEEVNAAIAKWIGTALLINV